MFPGMEIPQWPESKDKDTKESLGQLAADVPKKIFEWFKNYFTKTKEKGQVATLMGPLVYFVNFIVSLGKRKEGSSEASNETSPEPTPPENPETTAQLNQLANQIEVPSFDQTKIESTGFEIGNDGWTLCSGTACKTINKLVPGLKNVKAKDVVEALTKNTPPSQIPDPNVRRVVEANQKGENPVALGFVPQGNADEVELYFARTSRLMGNNLIQGANYKEMQDQLTSRGFSVCDIIVAGSTKYDHRAVGFLGHDGKWYILDPYFKPDHSTKPIPFEQYNNRIVIVVGMRAAPGTTPAVS